MSAEREPLSAARKCCICGATEDLRVAPIMTGDKFGEEPKWPVCSECIKTWYDTGETTAEGILRHRRGVGFPGPRPALPFTAGDQK